MIFIFTCPQTSLRLYNSVHLTKLFRHIKAVRPNKKAVFRLTQPYLNLLMKPRIFFKFSGKNIILCILEGEKPFKMHKILLFSRKNMCAHPP